MNNEVVRVCIGTEPRTEIARKVLEYSILKYCSLPVEFHLLTGENWDDRGKKGEGTGFSLLRWSIPEKFKYQGFAIYLDADQLVISDLAQLWNFKKDNIVVSCKSGNHPQEYETSVMLINCKEARDKLKNLQEIQKFLNKDPERKKYRKIMKLSYLKKGVNKLDPLWNVMDRSCSLTGIEMFSSPKAKLLHFTDVVNQPWYNPKHRAAGIWGKYFKESFESNYINLDEIKEACDKFSYKNERRPNGLNPFWLEYIGIN